MLTPDGPRLIEYNCRFGDPETQVLMLRLASDLVPILCAACDGTLAGTPVHWHDATALTVVMAANGYPAAAQTGSRIGDLSTAMAVPGATVFHAGTRMSGGQLVASGGRVLNICALAPDIAAAQKTAYRALDTIDWPQGFARRDIGWREMMRHGRG
jgi:phosphoribosylamine---glycine ligase